MKHSLLLVLMCSLGCPELFAQSLFQGRLVGANGEPMPLAHVELYPFNNRWQVTQRVEVEPDGSFQLQIPASGFYTVTFSGAMHRLHRAQFYVASDTVSIDVRLSKLWLDPDQSFTRVVGSFNNFEYDSGVALDTVGRGIFEATFDVAADTVWYELPGSTIQQHYRHVQLVDMAAATFRYKRLGEYVAGLPAEDGKATVRYTALFDTSQTVPHLPVVTFADTASPEARFYTYYPELMGLGSQALQQSIRIGQTRPENPAELQLEAQVAADDVAFLMEREEDAFQWKLYAMQYLNHGGGGLSLYWRGRNARRMFAFSARYIPDLDPALVRQILDNVPPTSQLWALQPYWIDVLADQFPEKPVVHAYMDSVIATHPDIDVRATVLFNRLDGEFATHGMTPNVTALLERIRTTFSDYDFGDSLNPFDDMDSEAVLGTQAMFGPTRYLDTPGRIENEDVQGQVTLLDFWTPDCTACAERADELREVQDLYAEVNFAIWSVALESNTYRAHQFVKAHRLRDFTLLHGAGGFHSSIAAGLRVYKVPYRVLINEAGEVIQVGKMLFGDALKTTLANYFAEQEPEGVR